MRLNSRIGTESLPASSLNCDRPLHSGIRAPETVMSTCGQITDSVMPYAPHRSRSHQNLLWPRWVSGQAMSRSVLSGVGH